MTTIRLIERRRLLRWMRTEGHVKREFVGEVSETKSIKGNKKKNVSYP